jgi:hypothetical protein
MFNITAIALSDVFIIPKYFVTITAVGGIKIYLTKKQEAIH